MRILKRTIKNERGQGLVEFALILPLFLFLVLGMLEYGWLLNAKITVNSAAKDVARTMIVAQGNQEDKTSRAETIANQILEGSYTMTFTPTDLPGSGETLEVTITNQVTPLIGLYVKGEQEIVGSASMRME